MEHVWKFVDWDIPELDEFKRCRAYILRERLNNGGRLNREEREWLTLGINHNSYLKTGIPVRGWAFDFSDVLHRFWVKQFGMIIEYYATDEKTLRAMLSDEIEEMVKLKK
jgi:hypothetical protein